MMTFIGRARERRRAQSARPPGESSKPRTMMADTSALFTSRVIVAVFGWAGTIIIIRSLSHTQWGEYTFVFSFLGIFVFVSNMVNSAVVLRGLLEEDAERLAGAYVLLRSSLGLLAYVLALSVVVLAEYPTIVIVATAVAGVSVLIATPSNAYDAFFNIHMRNDRVAVAVVLGQIAQFALTGVVAVLGGSLILFIVPAVLCEVVALWWKLRKLRGLQRVRYVVDFHRWGKLLRAAIPLAIGGSAAAIYYNLDAVMLSKLVTFNAVGIYGIAYKFAGVIGFLPTVLCAVLLGRLVRSWPNAREQFADELRRASTTLFVIALFVTIEFSLFAGPAIQLLYGAHYGAAAGATRLVIGGECVGFFTSLAVIVYAAMGRNRYYPVAAIAGLIVNLGLNLLFIPRFSYQGAAWVTLGTEVLVVSMLWVPLLRRLGASPISGITVLKVAVLCAVTAAIGIIGRGMIPWPVDGVLVAVVFVVGLQLARVPDQGGLVGLFRDDEALP